MLGNTLTRNYISRLWLFYKKSIFKLLIDLALSRRAGVTVADIACTCDKFVCHVKFIFCCIRLAIVHDSDCVDMEMSIDDMLCLIVRLHA